jgi:catechol 2,3-dioxygenase
MTAGNPVLHHVTMKTTRVPEMVAWYGTVVGMHTHYDGPAGAWLTNDAANHRIALLPAPGVRDDPDKVAHAGMHHLAFEYADVAGLLDAYERLAGEGITPHACLDHGMTTSLYYLDPDGNSVELQTDNFGDWAASSEWMRNSPEFTANPIGVPFDPSAMLSEHRRGVAADELHRRAYAGDFDPGTPLDLRLPDDAGS